MGLLLQHSGVRVHKARATRVLCGVLGHQKQREVCQICQELDVCHYLGGLLHPSQQGWWHPASGTNTSALCVLTWKQWEESTTTVLVMIYKTLQVDLTCNIKDHKCFSAVLPHVFLILCHKGGCWVRVWESWKGNVSIKTTHSTLRLFVLLKNHKLSCRIMLHYCGYCFQYVLILCNSIGTPLDSKYIDIGELIQSREKY